MGERDYQYGERYLELDRKDARRRPRKYGTGPGAGKGGNHRGWQVAEMWDSHHEIARRLLLGEKNTEIAKAMNCSVQQVGNVKNSPVVQDKLTIMRAARDAGTIEVAQDIQSMAPIALQRIREALETGEVCGKQLTAANILKESNNILDRTEGKPTQRIDSRSLSMTLTGDDIQMIKDRAKALAKVNFPESARADEGDDACCVK